MFKVEKRLMRLQEKHERQSEQQYMREKQQMNVFDFINSKLGGKRGLPHVHPHWLRALHIVALLRKLLFICNTSQCVLLISSGLVLKDGRVCKFCLLLRMYDRRTV